jgi:hypothetical protein
VNVGSFVMRKASLTIAACATLLWAGAALATPTPQQSCDYARITAWKVYTSCVDGVVATDAKVGVYLAEEYLDFKAFWKCRHAYFKKWRGFQGNAKYATSSCDENTISSRFNDNGDQTVTDNLSGLVWEKKDSFDFAANPANPHDADNQYTWSTGTGKGDGTAFTTFLTGAGTGLNVAGFAGAKDWRLPTLAELQTISFDFKCRGSEVSPACGCMAPCVDPALDAANTRGLYWAATSYVPLPDEAWIGTDYEVGLAVFKFHQPKTFSWSVRAVRGGL